MSMISMITLRMKWSIVLGWKKLKRIATFMNVRVILLITKYHISLWLKYTFFSHSRYGIKCFISDNYTYLAGKHCTGGPIGSYTTLQAAIAACSNNNRCGCIFDLGCDGDEWWIREGHGVRSSVPSYGSCAWEKRNGKQ